jgi:hypothetical protein
MSYEIDPVLKSYESPSDAVKHQLRIDKAGDEVVVHMILSPLKFSLDRDVMTVWKIFKDFNLWQEDITYSNVIGDQAEGEGTHLTIKRKFHDHYREAYRSDPSFDAPTFKKVVMIRKSVPGQLLAVEALTSGGRAIESYYIFSLSECNGATAVDAFMAYAPQWAPKENEGELWSTYALICKEIEERWKRAYIPRLRQLVTARQ